MLTEELCCNCHYYDGVKGVMGCAPCSFGEEKKMVLWNNQCDDIWLIPERFKTGTPTNADKIRSMTDLELALWYCRNRDCMKCPHAKGCRLVAQGILEWMKQETET